MIKITRILFIIALASIQVVSAQEKQAEKGNKKYEEYSFVKAIDIYENVANKGYVTAEMLKKLGNAYYFNADYENASKWYGKLIQMKDSVIEADYYFRYAQTLKSLKMYDEANKMMQQFNDIKDKDVRAQLFKAREEYLEFIKLQSGRYTIKPFENNSAYSDFAPSFYQGSLVFSSARDTGSLTKRRHTWNNMPFLDLYGGALNEDGRVVGVKKFSDNLNSPLHESSTAFTKDGKTVYFTRNNYQDGKVNRDEKGINRLKIYKATRNGDEWTNIQELPFNSDSYSVAHPALSPDETKLYFASDMPGTVGESDIFVVSINEDGTYGTPENLGTAINTEARETFPYVSNNGLLYFASDGHQGLGGLDIYVTKLKSYNQVDEVINVGEPVNSPHDDLSFIINEDTKIGFFASNRPGGIGSDDIYTFVENTEVIFECNKSVNGVVIDKETREIIADASISVIDENNSVLTTVSSNNSGQYNVVIDCKKGHFIRAEKQGYITQEKYVNASYDMAALKLDFELEKEKVSATQGDDLAKLLDLKPIYFNFDSATIRKDAEVELQKVIAAMEKYPSIKIDIRSHTDSRGDDAYNLALSERRAKATMQYLISKGIDASRLTAKGYGESELVNECANGVPCSREAHELNRRSEFVIMQ